MKAARTSDTDNDKFLNHLVAVKDSGMKLMADGTRPVRQMDLIAPGESILTEQRRWNASPPPLRIQG